MGESKLRDMLRHLCLVTILCASALASIDEGSWTQDSDDDIKLIDDERLTDDDVRAALRSVGASTSQAEVDKAFKVQQALQDRLSGVRRSVPASALSLPQLDTDNATRQAALATMQDPVTGIFNSPRYHSADGLPPFTKFNHGPVPINGSLAYSIVFSEAVEAESKSTDGDDILVGGLLMSGSPPQVPVATMQDLEDMYSNFAPLLPKPKAIDNWNDDAHFADVRLTYLGNALKRVEQPLFELGLSDAQLEEQVGSNQSASPLAQASLYAIDHMNVANYSNAGGGNALRGLAPGAQAMFAVGPSGKFVVLAIKLSNDLVYSRYDTADEWTLAKIALTTAEHLAMSAEHFMETHGLVEPVRVELMRHVSVRHPLHALLNHHMKGTFGLFYAGVERLFTQGTTLDDVSGWGAKGYLSYLGTLEADFGKDFESDMAARGLNDLPNYRMRDDSRRLLRLIRRFVRRFLKEYYQFGPGTKTQNVRNDHEIQAWAAATANTACDDAFDPYPAWLQFCGGNVKNFPSSFSTFNGLVATVTNIIHRVAVKHHMTNSDVLWESMPLPAGALGLFRQLPTTKGALVDSLRDFLPNSPQFVAGTVLLASAFRRVVSGADSLRDSYGGAALGQLAETALKRFGTQADRIENRINNREASSTLKYEVAKPSNLPFYAWI